MNAKQNEPIVRSPFLGSVPEQNLFKILVHNQILLPLKQLRRLLFGFPPNGAISAIRPSGQNRRHRCQAKQRTWLRRDVKRQTKACPPPPRKLTCPPKKAPFEKGWIVFPNHHFSGVMLGFGGVNI